MMDFEEISMDESLSAGSAMPVKTQNGVVPEPLHPAFPVCIYAEKIKDCKPRSLSVPMTEKQISHLENATAKFLAIFDVENSESGELKKTYLETAIRKVFWLELRHADSFSSVEWIIRFTIACAESDVTDSVLPYIIFHEACDWGNSQEKEQIANMFVDLKGKWRSSTFSTPACKNLLLRFSTELLSDLSKTTSAKSRGRLMCYVSARISISDKGAANILGDFNLGKSPTTEGLTTGLANNVHEFDKFRYLCNFLDYLRNPPLVIADGGFIGFKLAFENLLELMTPSEMWEMDREEGEHVEDGGRLRILSKSANLKENGHSVHATLKCLRFIPDPTPSVLMEDLRDDRIKRNLLSRFLVVAQYVCLPSKAKGIFEPTVEQLTWFEQMVQTALAILSRTSPRGPLFVERLIDHLESEAAMSTWKDAGCPSLESRPKADLSAALSPNPLKNQLPYPKVTRINKAGREITATRKSIKDMPMFGKGKYFGSMDVTRVLNKGPSTDEEFRSLGYQPPTLEFFVPVVEQKISGADSKVIKDEKFQWRALRILGKRTHIHFSNEAEKTPTKDIGSFLESYIMTLADRSPVLQEAKIRAQSELALTSAQLSLVSDIHIEDTSAPKSLDEEIFMHNDVGSGVLEEEMSDVESTNANVNLGETNGVENDSTGISKDYIRRVATQICPDWEKFGTLLKFGADEMQYWKESQTDPIEQASTMLQVWADNQSGDGNDSTAAMTVLIELLKKHYT